jgi:hypothetical protein
MTWIRPLFVAAAAATSLSAGVVGAVRSTRDGDGSAPERQKVPQRGLLVVDEIFLLPFPAVQHELNLTDEQKERLAPLLAVESPRERVMVLLTPEQKQRLPQLVLHVQRAEAFVRDDISKALELTTEQRGELERLVRRHWLEMRQFTTNANDAAANPRFLEARREAYERALMRLTPAQRTRWEGMAGKAFDLRVLIVPAYGPTPPGRSDDSSPVP